MDQYAHLRASSDPLAKLFETVRFEVFLYRLDKLLKRSDSSKGGRPPYDCALMFNVLVL